MPRQNRVKDYKPNAYYHVFADSVNDSPLFADEADYKYFLSLLKRYFQPHVTRDSSGRPYKNYSSRVDLLAFQASNSGIHLLLYQKQQYDLPEVMRRICGTYATYYNKKSARKGPLFNDRYQAMQIENESLLWPISRYLHTYDNKGTISSRAHYSGEKDVNWVKPKRVIKLRQDADAEVYKDYLADTHDYTQTLAQTKLLLATK